MVVQTQNQARIRPQGTARRAGRTLPRALRHGREVRPAGQPDILLSGRILQRRPHIRLFVPIAKRLNLEFSISAGYARIPYRHYNPTDDWEILIRDHNKTGVWHYFGPTKIEVALSVPLLIRKKAKGGSR